jgi:predicted PurR-regulated permease PerM
LLRVPVDVRSMALAVIAVLLAIFAMHWAKAVMVPLLLGVMLSYALAPLVDRLERVRIHRALSAGVLLIGMVCGFGAGVWALGDQANALASNLPEVAQKLRQLTRTSDDGSPTTIDKVQQAALELEKAAEAAASGPEAQGSAAVASDAEARRAARNAARNANNVTRVVVERPHVNIRQYLWSGTVGAITLLAQTTVVLFISFFFLSSGDSFRRKVVRLAGPTLTQKKVTLEVLKDVTEQIQRYLLVQVALSVIVGVMTALAFWFMGLAQPAVWGVIAGVTNMVPYFGAVATSAGAAVVAIAQFDSIDKALLVGAVSLAIHTVVGNLLAPWWMGRASRISPFAVFVSLLAFGWLWGVPGLFLGVPILMVAKAVCDRIEELKPVGELLGI